MPFSCVVSWFHEGLSCNLSIWVSNSASTKLKVIDTLIPHYSVEFYWFVMTITKDMGRFSLPFFAIITMLGYKVSSSLFACNIVFTAVHQQTS